jgi:glycosyltransferase involved in cell wall biosynthesis
VRLSIITPSFRSSPWLKLCVASVADQGVDAEHIVQDACSDDGTLEWLTCDTRVKAFVESDQGMYDAINRGLRRARGDLVAYLNCDEQYLPGALKSVLDFFERNPQIQVLFGDLVYVGPEGAYQGCRKLQPPLMYHTWVCQLSTLSCATFFRRELIEAGGFWFDTSYRCGGDGEWMVRLLRNRVRMGALRRFTSCFTRTGSNLGRSARAVEEWRRLRRTAPWWARAVAPGLVLHHRLRRLCNGSYFQSPFSYAIYTRNSPDQRVLHQVHRPGLSAAELGSP